MASELQTLDTIFNSRVFRIPDYQRGYAWGDRELKAFWQDLVRLGETHKHYTGQLTVEPVAEQDWTRWDEDRWLIEGKNYKPYYVVDGQQRLTTAIVLVKCLLDRVRDGETLAYTDKIDHEKKYLLQQSSVSRSYLFGYARDNPSYEYLKTQILGQPSNQYQGTETTYTANLRKARAFFVERLERATSSETESWFRSLTQRFLFSWYEVETDLDVFVVFETMNNRGKALSWLELMKNRLIYLSTLAGVPVTDSDRQSLRRDINDAWKTAYEFLGRSSERSLVDDEFLRAHWIMYFEYNRDKVGQFGSHLLDDHFTADRIIGGSLSAKDVQKYANSIQNSVKIWYDINYPTEAESFGFEAKTWVERIARLGRGAFGPLILASLQKAASDAELVELLKSAERFIFVVSRFCQRRADTGDSEFYRLAGQVFRGEKSPREAAEVIRARTDANFSLEKAITNLREEPDGFYSWDGLRYFLFEYEQDAKKRVGMHSEKVHWDSFNSSRKDHYTVEHIFPQNARANDWAEFAEMAVPDQVRVLHSLGNLLAISGTRNASFSNNSFQHKVASANGYSVGSYSELSVSRKTAWTPQDVASRGLEMLSFLERRWAVSLGDYHSKMRLLGIEFLEEAPRRVNS